MKGTTGFEAQIDKCLELAEYLYNKIKNREGYEMVFDGKPQHTNVCFWYIPPSLRSMEDNEERMNHLLKVNKICWFIVCKACPCHQHKGHGYL
ncbi:peptidylprolyl isomerase [Platysternon megacephalum]|uniref:glutamate decarboxylase n=1 Tax=Platysternon megacephalum TaxID=55544 RepID=A0A4D9DDU7_9SAUR|nr:peptidylprolyl isomerase [Platysternon megacephalum]